MCFEVEGSSFCRGTWYHHPVVGYCSDIEDFHFETLRHYVLFSKTCQFFSGFRSEANGYEVALLPGRPTGTASDLVQVLLQLDELTIFTPKGHTPLVEQITLQVKAGAKFSIG